MRDAVMNRTWQTSTAGQLAQAEFPYQRMHREPIHIGPPNMGAADRTPPPATPKSPHTNSGEREGGARARSCFFHVVRARRALTNTCIDSLSYHHSQSPSTAPRTLQSPSLRHRVTLALCTR